MTFFASIGARVRIPDGFYKVARGEFGIKIWHVRQDVQIPEKVEESSIPHCKWH
jgi:hypothetical protein